MDISHIPHGFGYLNQTIIRCALTLIKAGAKVTALNSLRETALHSACRSGSVECAQLMIDQGLDVNAPNVNYETPIHLMAHDSEKMMTIMEHSKWKRKPRSASLGDLIERGRRSRRTSLDLEEAQRIEEPSRDAPRRQSYIRSRSRPKARGLFVL